MNGLGRTLKNLVTRHDSIFKCRDFQTDLSSVLHRYNVIKAGTSVSYFSTLTQVSEADPCRGFAKLAPMAQVNLNQRRYKKKRAQSSKEEEDEEDESDDDELSNENPLLVDDILEETGDGSEAMTIDINSLRLDAFCKSAFNVTRAKVEESFYKGEIRINGDLPSKKSAELGQGDEVDMIKFPDNEDSNLMHIRRAIVDKIPDKATENGRLKVGIKRWQDLTVAKLGTKNEE